jgi:hypothetical protein
MAPVNAPLSWPNNSLSSRPAGMAALLHFTKAFARRALKLWTARAINSFPVPVSPQMSTVESVGATVSSCVTTFRIAALRPTIPSQMMSSARGSPRSTGSVECLAVSIFAPARDGAVPSESFDRPSWVSMWPLASNPSMTNDTQSGSTFSISTTTAGVFPASAEGRARESDPAVLHNDSSGVVQAVSRHRCRSLRLSSPLFSRNGPAREIRHPFQTLSHPRCDAHDAMR